MPPDAPSPRKRFRPRLVPTLFMLAVTVGVPFHLDGKWRFGLVGIGLWQVDRYHEQTAKVEKYHLQHEVRPPVTTLAEAKSSEARLDDLAFRRANLHGTLDMAHAQLLTGRYVLGQLGYAVIAPLQGQQGPYPSILVHLGSAPKDRVAAFLAELRAHPERDVHGRLQVADARVAEEVPAGTFEGLPTWLHPNPRALASRVPGLDPDLMLQAGEQASGKVVDPNRVPLDGYDYPIHPLPSKNVEYALTWFAVAATLVAVWMALSMEAVPAGVAPPQR